MMRTGVQWLTVAGVLLSATLLASCGNDESSPTPISGAHVMISGSPEGKVLVGDLYRFSPQLAKAPAADPVFTISNKPSWAYFDAKTGLLSGTPAAREVGVFKGIQISVLAGPAHAALPPFSITVAPNPNTPHHPVVPIHHGGANAVTVSWLAPADNTNGTALTNLRGYKLYYGEAPRDYSSTIKVSNPGLTTYLIENLSPGRYYFAVTAYNSLGEESDFSPEISTIVD